MVSKEILNCIYPFFFFFLLWKLKNYVFEKNCSISVNEEKGLENSILVCCFSHSLPSLALHKGSLYLNSESKEWNCFNVKDLLVWENHRLLALVVPWTGKTDQAPQTVSILSWWIINCSPLVPLHHYQSPIFPSVPATPKDKQRFQLFCVRKRI